MSCRLPALIFLLLACGPWAVAQRLSPQAQASLITVGPGPELYSAFGHTAIWIRDPGQGIDRAYNYGTFDFNADGFYTKFIRGTLPYQLSVAPLQYTLSGAEAEGRRVTQQLLNLDSTERQRLYDNLERNFLPQHRTYNYKFFHDNCSTRPRDQLMQAADIDFHWPAGIGGYSFREWMNRYLVGRNWARMGMNIGLGYPADRKALPIEALYLPDNLLMAIGHASLDGGSRPLVSGTRVLYEPPARPSGKISNVLFYSILTLPFVLLFIFFDRLRPGGRADKILLWAIGLVGLVLLGLWFGTNHGVTAWNYHLLLFSPLHALLLPFLPMRFYRNYFLMHLVMGAAGLFLLTVLGSSAYGLLPFYLWMLFRYWMLSQKNP